MSAGISGPAVAVAALGGVLVYAGFRGITPLQALRDVAGGKPGAVESKPMQVQSGAPGMTGASDSRRGAVVSAAQKYRGDKYNQIKRTRPGYSDCSSFVSKCLRDAGIDPPGGAWANTTNYLASGQWRKIAAADALPGDIAITVGHMVLVTSAGGGTAIGQQNSRKNVQEGATTSLFSRPFHYRTWTGWGAGKSDNGGRLVYSDGMRTGGSPAWS